MPVRRWLALLSFDKHPNLDTLVRFESKLLRDRWVARDPDARRALTAREARMMFPDAFAPGRYCIDRWVVERKKKAAQMWTGNKVRSLQN